MGHAKNGLVNRNNAEGSISNLCQVLVFHSLQRPRIKALGVLGYALNKLVSHRRSGYAARFNCFVYRLYYF
jgi:hypothetical protein